MNYVLYMAYMKDADYAGNNQRAASHFQIFTTSITGKGQVDALTTPNMWRTPHDDAPQRTDGVITYGNDLRIIVA
jgi:hypothetical protein